MSNNQSDRENRNYIVFGLGSSGTCNRISADFESSFSESGEREAKNNNGLIRIKLVQRGNMVVGDLRGPGVLPVDAWTTTHTTTTVTDAYKRLNDPGVIETLVGKSFLFLFCMRFDATNRASGNFFLAAQEFVSVLGAEAVRSLVLVVQQTATNACAHDELEALLRDTDGCRFLRQTLNNERDVPYVMWTSRVSLHERVSGGVSGFVFSRERVNEIAGRADAHDARQRAAIEREMRKSQQPTSGYYYFLFFFINF